MRLKNDELLFLEILETVDALAKDLYAKGLKGRHKETPAAAARGVKHYADLVSEADEQIEAALVAGIEARFPGDGIIGEEGISRVSETGRAWVLDPIDGTTAFLGQRDGDWAIVAARIEGDITRDKKVVTNAGVRFPAPENYNTLFSVIHSPSTDTTAIANETGAYLLIPGRTDFHSDISYLKRAITYPNQYFEKVELSAESSLDKAVLSSYISAKTTPEYRERLTDVFFSASLVFNGASGATEHIKIIRGLTDGWFVVYTDYTCPWDYVAGIHIVEAAGGHTGWFENVLFAGNSEQLFSEFRDHMES